MAEAPWQKALRLRSEAMNRRYGLPAPAPARPSPAVDPAKYYAGIIDRDPSVIQGAADLRAQSIYAGNQGADALRRLLINYGMVPGGVSDPYGWVNDETRALADKATSSGVSQFARMKRAYDMGQLMRRRQLAARGMIQSGAFTQSMGEGDRDFQLQQYDALQQLLDQANQARSTYAQGELDRTQQLNQLRTDAAGRAAQMPLPSPAAPARPAAIAPVAKPAAPAPVPAWKKALAARSAAMNKAYGL